MPWVRFDDQYPHHRKVAGLSDAAFRLATEAVFWSARNLTDGFISDDDLADIRPRLRNPRKLAAELTRRKLWHTNAELCISQLCPANGASDVGWVIHDYWGYQPRKTDVQRRRQEKQARQDKWLAKARRGRVTSRDASQDTSADTSRVTSRDSTPPRTVGAGPLRAPAPTAPRARAATPNGAPTPGEKPIWCGHCDQNTRQTGDPPRRCPHCHPLRVVDDPWATP